MVFLTSCVILPSIPVLVLGQDESYKEEDAINLLCKTNEDEFENVPLSFEKELPKWLKGSLVSL